MLTAAAIGAVVLVDAVLTLLIARALRWSTRRNERQTPPYNWHRELTAAGRKVTP